MLSTPISSYMFTQYADDDEIRAFFTAYNQILQEIYGWMYDTKLPIFIGNYLSGALLQWCVAGIYGQTIPTLTTSSSYVHGQYNATRYNQLAFNQRQKTTKSNQVIVSDDIFKRILTWNYYKADGFHFTVPWLKRRIMRFLLGSMGTDIANDQHWAISVLFASSGMTITISKGYRRISKSAIFGKTRYNRIRYNGINTYLISSSQYDFANIFSVAIQNGVLKLPFYTNVSVNIIG